MEILLPAKLVEDLGKMGAEAVGIKQAGAAVGAGGYEMQMIQSVAMLLPGHCAILQPETAHIGKSPMYAPPAKEDRAIAYVLEDILGGKKDLPHRKNSTPR